MKMTSGRRLQARRERALDRLLAQDPARWCTGQPEYAAREAQWKERREAEIATLKKRTGRF